MHGKLGRPQKQREAEDLLEDQDPKIPLLIHTDNISHNIYIFADLCEINFLDLFSFVRLFMKN